MGGFFDVIQWLFSGIGLPGPDGMDAEFESAMQQLLNPYQADFSVEWFRQSYGIFLFLGLTIWVVQFLYALLMSAIKLDLLWIKESLVRLVMLAFVFPILPSILGLVQSLLLDLVNALAGALIESDNAIDDILSSLGLVDPLSGFFGIIMRGVAMILKWVIVVELSVLPFLLQFGSLLMMLTYAFSWIGSFAQTAWRISVGITTVGLASQPVMALLMIIGLLVANITSGSDNSIARPTWLVVVLLIAAAIPFVLLKGYSKKVSQKVHIPGKVDTRGESEVKGTVTTRIDDPPYAPPQEPPKTKAEQDSDIRSTADRVEKQVVVLGTKAAAASGRQDIAAGIQLAAQAKESTPGKAGLEHFGGSKDEQPTSQGGDDKWQRLLSEYRENQQRPSADSA